MKDDLKIFLLGLVVSLLGCASSQTQQSQQDLSLSQGNQSQNSVDEEFSDFEYSEDGEPSDVDVEEQFSSNGAQSQSFGNQFGPQGTNNAFGNTAVGNTGPSNNSLVNGSPLAQVPLSNPTLTNSLVGVNGALNNSMSRNLSASSSQIPENSAGSVSLPANAASLASVAAAAAPSQGELSKKEETQALASPRLTWVGFDYRPLDGQVRVEIVSEGVPDYDILQEVNQKQQPELVVRLYKTALKKKIRRDINCSEFKSPVSFIRMREDPQNLSTDVVITLRDKVVPRLFAEKGNILITFSIPSKYFGNSAIGIAPESRGSFLSGFRIEPIIQPGSKQPLKLSKTPDLSGGAFTGAPADGGEVISSQVKPGEDISGPIISEPEVSQTLELPSEETFPIETGAEGQVNIPSNSYPAMENVPSNTGLSPNNFGTINGAEVDPSKAQAAVTNEQGNLQENEDLGEEVNDQNNFEENNNPENIPNQDQEQIELENNFSYRSQETPPKLLIEYQIAAVGNDGYALDEDLDAVSPKNSSNSVSGFNSAFPPNSASSIGGFANPVPSNIPTSNPGTVYNSGASLSGGNSLGRSPNSISNSASSSLQSNSANSPVINTASVDSEFIDLTGPDTVGEDSVAGAEKSSGGQVTRPVKLDFTGAKLSDVLKVLSEENGTNFIFTDQAVQDLKVNVSLKDVSWTDALGAILETYGLGYSQLPGNVVRIDKFANLKGQKIDIMAAKVEALKLQRTRQMVYKLSFAKAPDIEKSIGRLIDTGLDPRMKVTSDPRTNTVIIEAVPELLSKFKSIIEKLDTPTPQVRIAVKVVEATESFNYDVGVKWGTNLFLDSARGLGFGGLPFPKSAASSLAVDVPATKGNTATIGARLGSLSNGVNLDAVIGFSELRQNAKILQNTSVLVLDQQNATIVAGTTDYFEGVDRNSQTAAGVATTLISIQYNLTLNVTPAISADGSVGMSVKLDADTPMQSTAKEAVAGKSNKKLETFMIRKSGETAVIGGVYTTKKDEVVRAVPFFSKIPIIGWLFKSYTEELKKTELIIFVTPTIVAAGKSEDSSRGATFVEATPSDSTYASQGALDEEQTYNTSGAENSGSMMNAGSNSTQNFSNSSQNSSQNSGNNTQNQNNSQGNQSQNNSNNNSNNNNSSNNSDNSYESGEDQL